MAFLECHFHSDVLAKACTMNVVVPQVSATQIGMGSAATAGRKDYPVLYLLHGLSDDQSIWMRRTSIERYAAQYQLVVVMPDGGRSFYTDMETGGRYWTFLSQELPAIVAQLFPVSTRREDTFAAGLSMGGYGAFKLALRCPERYAGAVALSPVADIREWVESIGDARENAWIFGSKEELVPRGNDLFALAETALKAPNPPRLLQVCGVADSLYPGNQRLRHHLEGLRFPNYRYAEGPGDHTWEFWDLWIQEGLKFLLKP